MSNPNMFYPMQDWEQLLQEKPIGKPFKIQTAIAQIENNNKGKGFLLYYCDRYLYAPSIDVQTKAREFNLEIIEVRREERLKEQLSQRNNIISTMAPLSEYAAAEKVANFISNTKISIATNPISFFGRLVKTAATLIGKTPRETSGLLKKK